MRGKYFEEFEIGDEFRSKSRTITETDVINFSGVTGDFNLFHTSKTYVEEHSRFDERVVHGPLVFSMGLGLTSQIGYTEDTAIAMYGADNLRFPQPVFIDDTIHVIQIVSNLERKDSGGLVTLDTKVYNQDDDCCASWDMLKLVKYWDGADATGTRG